MPTIAHKSAGSVLQTLFFVAIFINLVYVNVLVFEYRNRVGGLAIGVSDKVSVQEVCGKDCVSDIYSSIKQATSSSEPSRVVATQSGDVSESKEYHIPIGSGTSMTENWTDVPGLQVYIDTSKYSNIKSVVFEASVQIPTGNQQSSVRLFNATDKHPVWYSEVMLDGGETKLLISKPIQLDAGNKLYSVQMKNSLKFQTNLLSSRVRITLQ